MRSLAGLSRRAWFVLVLAGLPGAVPRAGEPTSTPTLMPKWVVVKPGPVKPGATRPIEPTSFAVMVGAVAPKAKIPLELEIRNTSSAPIKVLGGNKGCSPSGCIQTTGQYPFVIPPGGTVKLSAVYTAPDKSDARTDQAFRFEADFYVAGSKTFAVPFEVAGEVVPTSTGTLVPRP